MDDGLVLVHTVVVAGDGAGTDVDACADGGVAEVAQVIHLAARSEPRLFGFAEVTDMRRFADVAFRPKVGVGAEDGARADGGLGEDAAVADGDVVREGGGLDDGEGADAALLPDAGAPEQLHEGFEDGVGADLHGGVDDAGFRAEDGDALGHEPACRAEAHGGIEVHHFGDGVGAENLVDAVGLDGDDALAVGDQHGRDVGEVELAVGVVGVEEIEPGEESFGAEAVDAGVDFGGMSLFGEQRFLLDDGGDLGAGGRCPDYTAVAGRVGRNGGEDGHGGMFAEVGFADAGDGLRTDQRDVSGEDEEVFGDGRGVLRVEGFDLLEGVAGAALLCLEDELHAGGGDGGADALGLMTDDAEDALGWNEGASGGNHVQQKGLSADFVQHLWPAALEAGAFAGGHDCDCEACGVHRMSLRDAQASCGQPKIALDRVMPRGGTSGSHFRSLGRGGRAGRCGGTGRGRNGDVEGGDRAELADRRCDFGAVADYQDRKFFGVDVLVGDARDIGGGHGLDAGFVFVEEVGGVVVEGQRDLLGERFVGRIVMEDEGVQHLVLRATEFVGAGRNGAELSDFVEHGPGRGDGAFALCACFDVEDAGVVVGRAEAAINGVGEAQAGADILRDARAEAAGEDLVHDAERVEVRVAALCALADEDDVGLIHIGFFDEVHAGFGFGGFELGAFKGWAACEWAEGGAQLGFHGGGVEVARDGNDHVVGDEGAAVPCLEVGKGDCGDGGKLRLAGVGAGGAVGELDGFAVCEAAGVVVAAGDAGVHLLPGELELFGLEGGVQQKLDAGGEDGVEVALEAGPAQAGGGETAAGFDAGGFGFELVVKLIAIDLCGSAGAPGLPVQADQADLGGRLVAAAAPDEDAAIDERQLVIFLEKEDESVGQLDPLWLAGMEGAERRDGDPGPGLGLTGLLAGLLGVDGLRCQQRAQQDRGGKERSGLQWAPPAGAAAVAVGFADGAVKSMRALVRLFSRKILLATRRMSAFWTASTLLSWRKSSRQSP